MRSVFDNPQMRMNIANDLLQQQIFDRITAIGQGKPLEVEVAEEAEDAEVADTVEAVAEDAVNDSEDSDEEAQSENDANEVEEVTSEEE
jgi:hypothetical protein